MSWPTELRVWRAFLRKTGWILFWDLLFSEFERASGYYDARFGIEESQSMWVLRLDFHQNLVCLAKMRIEWGPSKTEDSPLNCWSDFRPAKIVCITEGHDQPCLLKKSSSLSSKESPSAHIRVSFLVFVSHHLSFKVIQANFMNPIWRPWQWQSLPLL